MKTLYISDLDGTLLNAHAELSPYTVKTLNRLINNGVHFSVATARTTTTTEIVLKNVTFNIPIILMNGVLIYDLSDKRYIKKEILSNKIAANIINAVREVEQLGFLYTLCGDEMLTYYENLDNKALRDFVDERIKKYNKIFIQVDDFLNVNPTEDIIYFCFLDTREKIERIYSSISGIAGIEIAKYADNYSDKLWFLEVFSDTASKYNAVQFLRNYGGYDKVVGFGDNLNDIPLFRACDECYAVGNAKAELKEIATAVIDTHYDDGVAKWLEENVL